MGEIRQTHRVARARAAAEQHKISLAVKTDFIKKKDGILFSRHHPERSVSVLPLAGTGRALGGRDRLGSYAFLSPRGAGAVAAVTTAWHN